MNEETSIDDEIGTTRWFGESWRAAACHPRARIPTPVGEACAYCPNPIGEQDRGLRFPYNGANGAPWSYVHVKCFLDSILPPADMPGAWDE